MYAEWILASPRFSTFRPLGRLLDSGQQGLLHAALSSGVILVVLVVCNATFDVVEIGVTSHFINGVSRSPALLYRSLVEIICFKNYFLRRPPQDLFVFNYVFCIVPFLIVNVPAIEILATQVWHIFWFYRSLL